MVVDKDRRYSIPEEIVMQILFCRDGRPRWDNTAAKVLRRALSPEEYDALLLKARGRAAAVCNSLG